MKTTKIEIQPECNYDPKQDLELWKYFSDDAAKVKDKLWTISSWLFTVLGAVLGFSVKFFDIENLSFTQPVAIIIIAIIGIVMSIYAYWMITSYGRHIQITWNRTDYLRNKIEGLDDVWKSGYVNTTQKKKKKKSKPSDIPSFAQRFRQLATGFIVVFTLLFIVAFIMLVLTGTG